MHVIVPLAQKPLQQSPSIMQPVSFVPQVSEQEPEAWSQPPVQQSLSTMHEAPTDLQPGPVVVDPPTPVVPKPHAPLVQIPAQQSWSFMHGVLSWAQAKGPLATQMPSWQVAFMTHVSPPLQSPSISTMPGAGAMHWPPLHMKLAHCTGLLHGEPSGWEGATAPVPPTSWWQYVEKSERSAQRAARARIPRRARRVKGMATDVLPSRRECQEIASVLSLDGPDPPGEPPGR
jgi:hypothetical protein